MKTYYKLPCPGCHQDLPVRAEYFGKRVACKFCKYVFVPEPQHATGPARTKPEPEADTLHRRVAELEAELEQVRAEADARAADHAGALHDARRHRDDVARLEEEVRTLQQQGVEAAERHRQELEERQEELAGVSGEAEWLRSLVADLQDGERRAGEKDARLRAERDELQRQHQEAEGQAEQLRAKLGELEQALAEATAAHETLAKGHEETRGRWEAERQAIHGQWEEKHRAHAAEAEQRLSAVRDQHQQEWENLQRQLAEEKAALRKEAEERGQELTAARAEAERLHGLVAELQSRLGQVSDEAEGRVQATLTETTLLRDELTATQASFRKMGEEIDGLRAERDQLLEQLRKAPAGSQPAHDMDPAVLQKALEGVSPRVGWPWFDPARNDRPAPPKTDTQTSDQRVATQAAAPAPDQQLAAVQQEFGRERAALQGEVARLRKENTLLRQYLENFGVQLLEM